jgi:hypothetical protein
MDRTRYVAWVKVPSDPDWHLAAAPTRMVCLALVEHDGQVN